MTTKTDILLETLTTLDCQIGLAYPRAHLDYVIFGSTSLVIRGVLDRIPGDIDVFMTPRLWSGLSADKDWHVEIPNPNHPPILVNDKTPIMIHAFYDWSNEFADMNVAELLRTKQPIWYKNWVYPVVSVEEALRVKEAAALAGAKAAKHLPDIEVIKEWLASRN